MDKETLEGIVLELDSSLDSLVDGAIDFESFANSIEALRDRLKFLLDNDPDA